MTEFLKGYAAGANDMEAGRLVSDKAFDSYAERMEAVAPWKAEVESLRHDIRLCHEQRGAAEAKLAYWEARAEKAETMLSEYGHRLEVCKAKLAEAESMRDAALRDRRHALEVAAEVEKERDTAELEREHAVARQESLRASMDRARELAMWIVNLPTEEDGGKLEDACDAAHEIARILSGDE